MRRIEAGKGDSPTAQAKVSTNLDERIDKLARSWGVTRSDVIRPALDFGLAALEKTGAPPEET